MGTIEHEIHMVSLSVSSTDRSVPNATADTAFYGNRASLSPVNPVPGILCLMKKRKLFPELSSAAWLNLFALPHHSDQQPDDRAPGAWHQSPCLGSGMSTGFPFERASVLRSTGR